MNNLIRVEGHKQLFRDSDTNAIINTDIEAWEAYKRQREADRSLLRSIDKIGKLEKDVEEMKNILQAILTKIS